LSSRSGVIVIYSRIGVCESRENRFVEVNVVTRSKIIPGEGCVVFNGAVTVIDRKKLSVLHKFASRSKNYSLISSSVKLNGSVVVKKAALTARARISGCIWYPSTHPRHSVQKKKNEQSNHALNPASRMTDIFKFLPSLGRNP
jgi:hypothetical protein